MSTLIRKFAAAICCLVPTTAFAGAGADIQACIYLQGTPTPPWTANFIAGGSGTHCMNKNGTNVSVPAVNAGLNCGYAGYVEEKGSSSGGDTCETDKSHWVLSYQAQSGVAGNSANPLGAQLSYSGSTSVQMESDFRHNKASLSSSSPGTEICTSQALCQSDNQQWNHGSKGPLYIIFQPVYSPSSN